MEILPSGLFYICMAKMSSKVVSIPNCMVFSSGISAPTSIVHTQNSEPGTGREVQQDDTVHSDVRSVNKNINDIINGNGKLQALADQKCKHCR